MNDKIIHRGETTLISISADDFPVTELSDLPRVIGTGTENSINVFTVDRVRKSVRIVRIGSDMPYNFGERRDYMVIPYAD